MTANDEDYSQFDLSKEEKDKVVAEVVRYILFKTHQTYGCPIKREELTQIVTKNYRHRALPALVINEAKMKLASIFGYEMKELQRSRPSSTNHGPSTQQSVPDHGIHSLVARTLSWNPPHPILEMLYHPLLVCDKVTDSPVALEICADKLRPFATVSPIEPIRGLNILQLSNFLGRIGFFKRNRIAASNGSLRGFHVKNRNLQQLRLKKTKENDSNEGCLKRMSGNAYGSDTMLCGVLDAKSYILISQLPADVYQKYVEDVNTAHLTGFTFVIVGIVHLAGGKINEGVRNLRLFIRHCPFKINENLWHHLRRMGLQTDESHPVFVNVKLSLEALVQQRYLQKDKVSSPEGNTIIYELAERALDGSISQKINEFILQMVSKDVGAVEVD